MAEREVKIVITGEDRSKKALKAGEKSWKKFGKNITGFIGGATKALAKLGAAAALGIGAISVTSIKTAIEVESAFAGVIKTTEGLVDEFGILNKVGEDLRGEFRALALEIPTDLPDLMQVGELGGQLGIAKENLVSFTKTVAALGEATNLTREQAATSFAQISNIMGTSQEDFDRMGSSVVALGNSFATTESDIVNFATRISATGRIAGLAEADVFGIAAAFTSVGVQAEAGGTAVQKVLTAMTIAVAQGGDKLGIFAATAGLSAEEFATAFREDAAGAFTDFVEGLGKQGKAAFGTLEELELQDQRLIRAFLSLSGAGDLLGKTIAESNLAWEENTALTAEAEARYRTFASQLKIAKNTIKDIALSIGEALLPFVREMLVAVAPFIKEFAERLPELLETKVIPAIEGVIGVVKEIIEAIKEGDFGKVAEIMGGHLRTMYSKALEWVQEHIGPLVDAAAAFLSVWVSEWVVWFEANKETIKADLGKQIRDWIKGAIAWIEDNWDPLKEQVKATLKAWAAKVVEWFNETVVPAVQAFGEKIRDWIKGAIGWTEKQVETLGPILGAVLEDVAVSAIEWFEDTVEPAAIELGATLSQIITEAITEAEKKMPEASVAFGTVLANWVSDANTELQKKLPEIAAQIGTTLGNITRTAIGLFAESGTFTQMRDEMFLNIWKGIIVGSAENPSLILAGHKALFKAITSMWHSFIVALTGDPSYSATFSAWFEGVLDNALEVVQKAAVLAWASVGGGIIDGVWKGLEDGWDNFKKDVEKKFKDLVNSVKSALGISSPSRVFAELGLEMMIGLGEGITEGEAQVIKKLSKAIGRIVNAFSQLVELQKGFGLAGGQLPNIGPFLDQFELTIRTLFWRIEGLIEEFGEKRIKKVRKSAKRLREIIQAVMIDMSGIALVELPDMNQWRDQIIALTRAVMQALGHLAFEFGEKGLEAAAVWAGSVRDILGLVKPAVDALKAMTDFVMVANLKDKMRDFADSLVVVVFELARVAANFIAVGEDGTVSGLEAAERFSAAAATIVGVVKPGVDALKAMTDFAMVADLKDKMRDFADSLVVVVFELARVAANFIIVGEDGTVSGLEAAERFSAAAAKIASVVEPGIKALTGLMDFTMVANLKDKMRDFADSLVVVVFELARVATNFIIVGEDGTVSGLEAAERFAQAASKIVGIVGPGITALTGLMDFAVVEGIKEKAKDFAEHLSVIVFEIAQVAGWFITAGEDGSLSGLEAAERFGAAAATIVGVVGPGITALAGLMDFTRVEGIKDKARDFAEHLSVVVFEIAEVAKFFVIAGEDGAFSGLEAAAMFGTAATAIVSTVEPGIKALASLLDFTKVENVKQKARDFAEDLGDVVNEIGRVAKGFVIANEDGTFSGLEGATIFATAAGKIVALIEPAIKALASLGTLAKNAGLADKLKIFAEQITQVLTTIQGLATSWSAGGGVVSDLRTGAGGTQQSGLDAAVTFADAVSTISTGIKGAIDLIDSFMTYKGRVIAGGLATFAQNMLQLRNMLSNEAASMELVLPKAESFETSMTRIGNAIKAGLDAAIGLDTTEIPGLSNLATSVASMLDAIVNAVRVRLSNFFNIGFTMGRLLAQGIISGLESGLANMTRTVGTAIIPAANGFSGIVTSPTLFLAGERGPESVNITPGGASGGIHIENLNVSGSGNAGADVRNTIRLLEYGTVSP